MGGILLFFTKRELFNLRLNECSHLRGFEKEWLFWYNMAEKEECNKINLAIYATSYLNIIENKHETFTFCCIYVFGR